MNLTDDEVLKFLKGSPIFIEDICAIFPPTVGAIVDEGYENFQKYVSVLTATKPNTQSDKDKELKDLMKKLSDFQYILLMANLDPQIHTLLKKGFRFFTHEDALFSLEPAQIVIGPIAEKHILSEDKFYYFQRLIRRMCFLETEEDEIIIYDDDPEITKRLKLQQRDRREKLRRAKAKEAKKNGTDLKFSDLIGSITLNDCGLNIINVWDISYYAFHDQLKRMGWRDQFNINQRAALAGAKIEKSQLKHWMRSIADSDKS